MKKILKWIKDPKIVSNTPLVTVCLLEGANVSQIWRMWTERTADGQSLAGWLMVTAALVLWANYYKVCTPDQKKAFYCTLVGICLNCIVVFSVIYFRYIV